MGFRGLASASLPRQPRLSPPRHSLGVTARRRPGPAARERHGRDRDRGRPRGDRGMGPLTLPARLRSSAVRVSPAPALREQGTGAAPVRGWGAGRSPYSGQDGAGQGAPQQAGAAPLGAPVPHGMARVTLSRVPSDCRHPSLLGRVPPPAAPRPSPPAAPVLTCARGLRGHRARGTVPGQRLRGQRVPQPREGQRPAPPPRGVPVPAGSRVGDTRNPFSPRRGWRRGSQKRPWALDEVTPGTPSPVRARRVSRVQRQRRERRRARGGQRGQGRQPAE